MSTSSDGSCPDRGWSRRVVRQLAVATIAAAFVTAGPTAWSKSAETPDAVGDVVSGTADGLVPVPERTLSDFSNTILTHGARRVTIRVDYVDLQKLGHHELDMEMVTNEGVHRNMELSASPGRWSGSAWMWTGQSKQVCMDVLRHSINYEANVMKFSFPTRCASNPRWVKLRIGATVDDNDGIYVDDAFRDRALTAQDPGFAWSSRVYR